MALEHICSERIIQGKKISLPEGACIYRIKSGFVRIFGANPSALEGEKKIPERARKMSFDEYEKHALNTYYGKPTFYDEEENILKYCNGIRLWAKQ